MKVRFIILPHAGGAAHAYQGLARALAPGFDVYCHDLPGHGRRAGEALLADMEGLCRDLERCAGPLPGPWALFGHSMGALLGHAFIRTRQTRGDSLPLAFFASGTPAPQGRTREAISRLPEERFWSAIAAFGNLPAEALAHPEFRAFFEALLRSDFAAVEGYCPPGEPLETPLHVFYGQDEMTPAEAASWQHETRLPVGYHPLPGGHFFLLGKENEIGGAIGRVLAPAAAGGCTDDH